MIIKSVQINFKNYQNNSIYNSKIKKHARASVIIGVHWVGIGIAIMSSIGISIMRDEIVWVEIGGGAGRRLLC